MSDSLIGIAQMAEARLGRILKRIATWLAYFGGFMLTAAAVLTVISIVGRSMIWAGLGPVPGDFELVEITCAVAVFSFLPWSQINRGQVTVDVLADAFPPRLRTFLGMAGDTAMAAAAIVIAWRLWLGLGERLPMGSDSLRGLLMLGDRPYYTETTFILRMPVWYGYALSMVGAAFFAIVCVYTVWRAVNWTIRGHEEPIS
ncbi:MAG: TRAP transporter small permease subunit [Paracoccaceae bacterium]